MAITNAHSAITKQNVVKEPHKVSKIGIFAGAFDPIHDGHLAVAHSALDYLGLDELLFMVEVQPWGLKKPIEVKHRRIMVDLAIENQKGLSQLILDDVRFNITHTLPQIIQKYPGDELYFIFGADVFLKMNATNWPGLEKLLKHHIVVFERSNITNVDIEAHARNQGIITAIIPSMHPQHSSTDVRSKANKRTLLIPEVVAAYIKHNSLY